ncbi:hypothetical protein [Chitinibacter tainanensis]|uniref:hypothetical protein n=1 Tax=Chitinibacter tainanensis TaxID=230667 RepID=UPI000415F05F|nr:hypothetical protein [Chitinibacter tainanensis]
MKIRLVMNEVLLGDDLVQSIQAWAVLKKLTVWQPSIDVLLAAREPDSSLNIILVDLRQEGARQHAQHIAVGMTQADAMHLAIILGMEGHQPLQLDSFMAVIPVAVAEKASVQVAALQFISRIDALEQLISSALTPITLEDIRLCAKKAGKLVNLHKATIGDAYIEPVLAELRSALGVENEAVMTRWVTSDREKHRATINSITDRLEGTLKEGGRSKVAIQEDEATELQFVSLMFSSGKYREYAIAGHVLFLSKEWLGNCNQLTGTIDPKGIFRIYKTHAWETVRHQLLQLTGNQVALRHFILGHSQQLTFYTDSIVFWPPCASKVTRNLHLTRGRIVDDVRVVFESGSMNQ